MKKKAVTPEIPELIQFLPEENGACHLVTPWGQNIFKQEQKTFNPMELITKK